jgi:two-component system, OmpR family, sensor histidine kinase MprB
VSLRSRIVLISGAAVALAVIAVAVAAYAGTRSDITGQLDQSLQSLTGSIMARAGLPSNGGPPGGGPAGGPAGGPQRGGRDQGARANEKLGDPDEGLGLDADNGPAFGGAPGVVTLIHRNGYVYVPPAERATIPVTGRARQLAARGEGSYFVNMTVDHTPIRVLATGIGIRGALLVALPLRDVRHTLSKLLLLLVLIAAGGILVAALLGLLVAREALAPIARFTRQTETIAAHPDRLESERLDVDGGDELARLAQTFNRTLDALERSVQSQRNLVADASHELRTPIATIRANLQLMRDEHLLTAADREALRRDVIEELDELTALVGDVVELARGSKLGGEPGEVRVDQIVSVAVERTRRRAPQLVVSASLEPTLVMGEGDRIARAVANLLDNAAKYGRSGGAIEVTLAGGALTVRDHGPGFQEQDLPFVFDRFHRARDARSQPGSGLGLAIVRQAAEAHGGFVRAANAPGGGALLEIGFGPTLELDDSLEPGAVSQSPASS